jgi:hypothetical protein
MFNSYLLLILKLLSDPLLPKICHQGSLTTQWHPLSLWITANNKLKWPFNLRPNNYIQVPPCRYRRDNRNLLWEDHALVLLRNNKGIILKAVIRVLQFSKSLMSLFRSINCLIRLVLPVENSTSLMIKRTEMQFIRRTGSSTKLLIYR